MPSPTPASLTPRSPASTAICPPSPSSSLTDSDSNPLSEQGSSSETDDEAEAASQLGSLNLSDLESEASGPSSGPSIPPSTTTSTPTLINAAANSEPHPLRLTFSRNNPLHATLYSSRGVALYRVRTNAKGSRTEVCDLAPRVEEARGIEGRERVVATVKRREVLPAVVVFEHRRGRAVRVSRWLREVKPAAGDVSDRYILQTLFGEYTWKSDDRYRLALFSEDDQERPIAYYKKIEEPPTIGLVVRAGFDEIQVEVITSFIELERRLREKEKIQHGERVFGTAIYQVVGY